MDVLLHLPGRPSSAVRQQGTPHEVIRPTTPARTCCPTPYMADGSVRYRSGQEPSRPDGLHGFNPKGHIGVMPGLMGVCEGHTR